MKILLIEPNRLLARTYQAMLERAGHAVVVCYTGQAAIHAADVVTPDLVILEVQMPRASGIEFLYEFRSYTDWQQVPVVLHTFVPQASLHTERLKQLGVWAHLYKPATDLVQLRRAVDEAVTLGV